MELTISGNHRQTPHKIMKNQGENINGSNESHELIRYIANLIGYLYIFHFSMSSTYISDLKREYN